MPTLRLERVILEEAGYVVEGVTSGEAALELIAEEPPALVILDIGLPGIDGFTTCQRIRESSQVPVVVVTGKKTAADQKQGTSSGANGYVTKPFLADQLIKLVGEIISESASSPSEDGAQPDSKNLDGYQTIDSALPWDNVEIQDPWGEEETEEDPTEVAVVWNSHDFEEHQSPLEDSDFEDSMRWYDDEPKDPSSGRPGPEFPGQDVSPEAPASEVAFNQEESSVASSLEEQPAGPTGRIEDESVFSPPADEQPDEPNSELYEGTMRLRVVSSGPVKNLLNFVGELRQNTQLRLLRLVASQRSESMDIWLGLREPLYLITVLGDIPGVCRVEALPDIGGDEEERRVTVTVGQ